MVGAACPIGRLNFCFQVFPRRFIKSRTRWRLTDDYRLPKILYLLRAHSSVGEHCLHTAGVVGSNPAAPTTFHIGIIPLRLRIRLKTN